MDFEKEKLREQFLKFSEEKKAIHQNTTSSLKNEVLIVDGLNTYIRCYCSMPSMNDNGSHVGGVSGFLKSLGYAIKTIKPSHVVIVFDGNGGSLRRRKIFPEYKKRRKTSIRLNRTYEDSVDEHDDAKQFTNQLLRLVMYLDTLPVKLISVDHVEADDTIAYITNQHFLDSNITIMSTDKDFLQLTSERVKVWSPTKKRIYGPMEVLNEYGIHPKNFTLFRAMDGDDNDNIDGIKGAGIKRILKAYPFLSEDKKHTIDDILQYSKLKKNEQKKGQLKIYDAVLDDVNKLQRNFDLMQLDTSIIQSFTQIRIQDILKEPNKPLNRYAFSNLITQDKMWNAIPNSQIWLAEVFNRLNSNVI